MTTQPTAEIAVAALTGWKSSPAIRQKFGSVVSYLQHLQNPESSAFKIVNNGGEISVVENKNRQLSGADALEIIKSWQNDPAIRSEFPTLNIYRAYIESKVLGKSHIIGQH